MKKIICISLAVLLCNFLAVAQLISPDRIPAKDGDITIQPIKHATLMLAYKQKTIYVDPTGGADAFKGMDAPDIILITDIHGDHFDLKTLEALPTSNAVVVAPQAVADKIPSELYKQKMIVLKNGDKAMVGEIEVMAVPMYNLPEATDAFHTKGRGNGYVLEMGGKRIYISGDTEDIPEMRDLKNIDVAFVCMNLPYTMDVNQAASGVLAFQPKIVYPYHYRGQDINMFKTLVEVVNKDIEVRLRDWYATK